MVIKNKRYPNLSTVLMVEDFLKDNQATPLKISKIKKGLPKQTMHQTLKIILEYLCQSGKVINASKGFQWIYTDSIQMDELMKNSVEI